MTFEPVEYELQQVLVLLQESQSADTDTQRRVQQKLIELQGHPKFCCYLVFILNQNNLPNEPRSLAGLILKNNIRSKWKQYDKYVQDYVKLNTLQAIGDQAPLIRATVGIIITTIFLEDGHAGWPDLLPTLQQLLGQQNYNLQEGSLGAIQKVFEDSGDRLENQQIQPLMMPILSFFSHANAKMRGLAMSSFNNILMVNNDPIADIIDQYIPELFNRAHDNETEVQRQLCRSLCLLLDAFMDKLVPHLPNIIDYIIVKSQEADESIALEACEFYLSLSENPDICKQVLQPVLPKLIPVLLICMRYSDEDIAALKGDSEEDDMMQPDRDEDIKPRFHKGQNKGTSGDDSDDEDDDDSCTEWNIRRCSAASLDVLAGIFKNEILEVLLPCIQEALSNSDWRVKESGILALGAIAEGCMEGVKPHLPQLIPFLLQTCTEKKPLVRSISCWTLSRYCSWVVDEAKNEFLESLIMVLLQRILDGNKKVQEAACSAFASFEEEGAEYLQPYLEQIITVLVQAFRIYQAKNLLILYDALSTLAHSVNRAMAEERYVQALMPTLMDKLMRVGNDDKEIFPLVECISAVATATGQHFLPYAEPIFTKCVQFVVVGVEQTLRATQAPNEYEMPEKDTHVVSLDLLSGIIESLGQHMQPLVQSSNIVQMVLASTMDVNADVRQSSFALLGDLVKTCWQHVKPFLGHFIAVITVNLDANNISVCNNAIWCLGEMSIRAGAEMKPFVPAILPYLVAIANKPNLQRTLLENTALTLGRLGIYCAEETAPHLQTFVRACCTSLRNIKDNSEKYSAFQGLCNLINHNPAGIVQDFIFWCDAIASWNEIQPELKNNFIQILNAFRGHMGEENWNRFIAAFPPPLRERLAWLYNV